MRSRSRSTSRLMDEAGVRGANVFALNEPDREPAYRAPNDRVLRWAAEVPDRLFPFVRLSLDEDPLGEAERCLALGARGIKLHPRAQAFRVDDPSLEAVFALADERRLPGAHPRRPRSAAGHAARARPRRRAAPRRLADPGARGDRGPGRHRRAGAERREHLLRQLDLDAARPAQPVLAGAAGADPVGLRHPVRRAARRAQRVRARGSRERRRRRAPARDAARQRARPARGAPAASAARRRSRRRSTAPRTRASAPPCTWRAPRRCSGWACPSTSDSSAWPRRRWPRRASTRRPSSCAARPRLWEQWAETLVPGAPPDLVGRGRVLRLLNQAQADTVLA